MSYKNLVKKIQQDLDSLEVLPEILKTIQTKSSFANMIHSIKSMLKELLKDNRLELYTMDMKVAHARDVTSSFKLKIKESLRFILLKTSKKLFSKVIQSFNEMKVFIFFELERSL